MQYQKLYSREDTLLSFCAWQEYQQKYLTEQLEWEIPPILFDTNDGLAVVYFEQKYLSQRFDKIVSKIKKDPSYIKDTLNEYKSLLKKTELYWSEDKKVNSITELCNFYDITLSGWLGYSLSYFIPNIEKAPQKDKDLAMSLRQSSDHFLEENDKLYKKILPDLFPKLDDLSLFISAFELKNKRIPSKDTLKLRANHYVYYDDIYTSPINDFRSKSKIDLVKENQKKELDVNEIKGQTAMKGFVKGKVRVVLRKNKILDVQEGEILVATMTTPDYIPAMKKAVAFVTDEGGITCHAAIVAREMEKPCVIGTKVATQVFKDGDLVEVDADKGIVRKL